MLTQKFYSEEAGYAFPMTADVGEITVGGAIQTGSHGSGVNLGSVSTQVRSLQLVLANGSVVEVGPNDQEALKAMSCGLGAFGVITQVELSLVPRYNVITYTYKMYVFGNCFWEKRANKIMISSIM